MVLGTNVSATDSKDTYSIKYLEGANNFESVVSFEYQKAKMNSGLQPHFIENLGMIPDPLKPA